jgi:hypothetical protein
MVHFPNCGMIHGVGIFHSMLLGGIRNKEQVVITDTKLVVSHRTSIFKSNQSNSCIKLRALS